MIELDTNNRIEILVNALKQTGIVPGGKEIPEFIDLLREFQDLHGLKGLEGEMKSIAEQVVEFSEVFGGEGDVAMFEEARSVLKNKIKQKEVKIKGMKSKIKKRAKPETPHRQIH